MVQVLVLRSHGTRMALPSWIEVVVDTGVGVVNDGGEDGEENTARSRLARRVGRLLLKATPHKCFDRD